jgi:hypothetical protein
MTIPSPRSLDEATGSTGGFWGGLFRGTAKGQVEDKDPTISVINDLMRSRNIRPDLGAKLVRTLRKDDHRHKLERARFKRDTIFATAVGVLVIVGALCGFVISSGLPSKIGITLSEKEREKAGTGAFSLVTALLGFAGGMSLGKTKTTMDDNEQEP